MIITTSAGNTAASRPFAPGMFDTTSPAGVTTAGIPLLIDLTIIQAGSRTLAVKQANAKEIALKRQTADLELVRSDEI